jgi:hypothetical protein
MYYEGSDDDKCKCRLTVQGKSEVQYVQVRRPAHCGADSRMMVVMVVFVLWSVLKASINFPNTKHRTSTSI